MLKKSNSPLLMLLTVFVWVYPFTANGADHVRIGIILPLSGSLAEIAKTHKRGHEFAIDEINEMGGIRALNGAQLELIYVDSKGDPFTALEQMGMMDQLGVVAIMGGYQSSVVLPTSAVAEELKIPYVVTTALSEKITKRGFKYTFRPEASINDFVRDQYKFIRYLFHDDISRLKIALLYQDSLFGQFTALLQREYARIEGIEIAAEISYPQESKNFSSQVRLLQLNKPDVILQTSYLRDGVMLAKLMHENGVAPKAVIATGAGPKDPAFISQLGERANGWFVVNEWNHTMMKFGVNNLNKRFRAKYGVNMDGISAMCYLSTWIIKEALERAGSSDRSVVRNELDQMYIDSGVAAMTPIGYISFDSTGQNHAVNLITQIVNGEHRTVWPPELASDAPRLGE